MNIAIDMMGGDYAPLETAIGVSRYFKQTDAKATTLLLLEMNRKFSPFYPIMVFLPQSAGNTHS
jgi:fatty acid/phospholipid biosynthesis enzyme